MSRWDDRSLDNHNYEGMLDDEEEARLLKKFTDYRKLEKKELDNRKFLEVSNKTKSGVWANRFIISAIIQVGIITALTISLVIIELVYSEIQIMQSLTSSFDGPAKWFFFGYIMYMTLVVAIAITAIFYNHLEVNLRKEFRHYQNFLAGIHLIGINIGGTATMLLMMWAGLEGSIVPSVVAIEVIESESEIIKQFFAPIVGFVVLLTIGVLSGGIAYLSSYLQKT